MAEKEVRSKFGDLIKKETTDDTVDDRKAGVKKGDKGKSKTVEDDPDSTVQHPEV